MMTAEWHGTPQFNVAALASVTLRIRSIFK